MGATGPEWVRPAGSPQTGKASYYGPQFTGRRMANGRRFNPHAAVVAHRTLPLGTTVLVRNLGNGRATTATVEDRGPFIHGRILDLSPRLAAHLGMVRQGVAPVEVMPVELAEAPEPAGAGGLTPSEGAAPR
ncbi:septal ring lytic transglycosylase RlpA family protein [Roseicella aquatilis]|uniref:Endolytic peptidoglycan transglycosylase RlpA n=2 Tax=Roseicella aquatilis TaxID=2527868 RepID=A0A4R4DV76_9PROT|nr:septal ring lytic transglycosylase RlpA family protein [Roseicella aquatilis]